MATVTRPFTTTIDTNSGTHTVTGAPTVNDLIILVVADTGSTTSVAPTDNNPDGLGTYTRAVIAVKASSADYLEIWVRNALIGSAASTVFTHASGTTTGGAVSVLSATGMNQVGAAAVRQVAKQDNQAGGGTPTPAFGVAALTTNPIISAVHNAASPAGVTVRGTPAYTSRANTGYLTPTTGLGIMTIDSGETATSIAWGSTSASAFSSVAVELNADNVAPTVTLNSPADASSDTDTTPTLDFTGTDADANSIEYDVQIGTVNTFDSVTSTIAYDNASSSNTNLAFSHTVAGKNRLLVVTVGIRDTAPPDTVTSITYGGIALTKLDGRTASVGSVDVRAEMWYLVDPPLGANNVSVVGSGPFTRISIGAISFTGVNQTTPFEANNWAEGTASPAAVSATSTSNNAWAVNSVVSRDATASTPGTGETERVDVSAGTSHRHIAGHEGPVTPAGSITMNPTVGPSDWVAIIGILKPGTEPLLDRLSVSDAGFVNPDTGGDTHPFNSGENIQFTVQEADALATGTYYWRVRGQDSTGSKKYGSWSSTRSFTITSGGQTAKKPTTTWRRYLVMVTLYAPTCQLV